MLLCTVLWAVAGGSFLLASDGFRGLICEALLLVQAHSLHICLSRTSVSGRPPRFFFLLLRAGACLAGSEDSEAGRVRFLYVSSFSGPCFSGTKAKYPRSCSAAEEASGLFWRNAAASACLPKARRMCVVGDALRRNVTRLRRVPDLGICEGGMRPTTPSESADGMAFYLQARPPAVLYGVPFSDQVQISPRITFLCLDPWPGVPPLPQGSDDPDRWEMMTLTFLLPRECTWDAATRRRRASSARPGA